MNPQDELLSPKQAAALLGIHIKTVHDLLNAGLKHQRITPRIIRIKKADLLTFGQTRN